MSSIQHLAASLPWAIIVPLIASQGIPYLSALVSAERNTWRGVSVAVLAFASAFASELMADHYQWKVAFVTAFATWAAARLHDKGITEGSPAETTLHAVGSRNAEKPA